LLVDDIIIFGMDINVINVVNYFLSKSFGMKGLGESYVILKNKLIQFGVMDTKTSPTP
jgi:hypothetical protein